MALPAPLIEVNDRDMPSRVCPETLGIALASERQADLVIVGSRCLHGLDRWLLGSVARNVLLHTHASVLIVRNAEVSEGS